jgi:uncharacterized protein (DUF1684 family)
VLSTLALALAVAMSTHPAADPAHLAEIEAWKTVRVANLKSEDGWLSVVGLFWLSPGENTVGSGHQAAVILPDGKAPKSVGTIVLEAPKITFRPAPGADVRVDGAPTVPMEIHSDGGAAEPTILSIGPVRFYVIERDHRYAVRVKDSLSEARKNFHGLTYFPLDPSWRIEARFEPYDPPRSISVPNVLGHVDAETSPGAVVFTREGKILRLDAVLEKGETDYFVIFGDRTNGTDTYGAGRFLYVSPPVDGKAVIDFNKAYNPPCVFTPYATCPIPPSQNRLPIRVDAGEKEYAH